MAFEDEELEYGDHDSITLTLDDGTEIDCTVLAVFPVDDKQYIALLPEKEDTEGEVYLYQFIEKENDEIELVNIEDDDEFEAVSDAFDELIDEAEFDDLMDDEEEDEDKSEE